MNASCQAPRKCDVVLRMLIASILVSPGCLTAASLISSSFSSGRINTNSSIELQSSIEPVVGFRTAGNSALGSGFVSQRYDTNSVSIEVAGGGFAEVPETGTLQLEAHSLNDDGTFYEVTNAADWSETSPAISSLIVGLVQADVVGQDSIAPISATWFGVNASRDVTVFDTISDNFTTAPYNFAGDGIPDDWQLRYFAEGATNADPMALAADGQRENYFFYFFDLDPTQLTASSAAQAVIVEESNEQYIGLSINRRKDLPATMSFAVQFGDNLPLTQGITNGVLVSEVDNPNGTVTEVWRDVTPMNAARFGLVDVAFNNP